MFIHPFFHLFVCSLKKTSHAGPVEDQTALRVFNYYYYSIYFKDLAQTVRMHMHMLIWNFGGHMFSWTLSLISCKSFSTVKVQRP